MCPPPFSEWLFYEETQIYSFNPSMSNVSPEFAAADPDFWTTKPEMLAKATTVKRNPKIRNSFDSQLGGHHQGCGAFVVPLRVLLNAGG